MLSEDNIPEGHSFTGRGVELHVATEGLALTQGGVFGRDGFPQVADWEDVAAVKLRPFGKVADVQVEFADGRSPWVVRGVRLEEAQWAEDLIRDRLDVARARTAPTFGRRASLQQLPRTVREMLNDPEERVAPLLDYLLLQAAHNGASDVHFEPMKASVKVRYRLDGVLVDAVDLPSRLERRLVSRLKVIGNMAIYRRDRPQEGRCFMELKDRSIDLRISILPTVHGEKATVRLFDSNRATLPLDQLGMTDAQRSEFVDLIEGPQGAILLTGPSGSGKTTTMYSALRHIHEKQGSHRDIATVEDPVEYDLGVINQTQVDPQAGLTFAAGLRTVLRQDPDVIMVGEIRDPETAQTAIQAGLTGHLLLSTIHARSAAGVFARLMEMGLEPYLVASSVTAAVAQRLVRLNCQHCAAPARPSAAALTRVGDPGDCVFMAGRGCDACNGTGYAGRTGVFEVLRVDDRFRGLITGKLPAAELEAQAGQFGTRSLRDAALDLVRAGATTLDEIARVLGWEDNGR